MRRVFFYINNFDSIDTNLSDLLNRFETYSKAINEVADGSIYPFTILTTSKLPKTLETKSLKITTLSHFFPIRFVQSLKILKGSGNDSTLIAGNNHSALLFALALRHYNSSLKVQASLHGKLSLIFSQNTFTGKIKAFLVKLLIPKVDSLRIVDELEKKVLPDYFNILPSSIVIAPVPVEIPAPDHGYQKPLRKVVGFVGRVHSERGVHEWVDIVLNTAAIYPDIEFLVIGDGNLTAWMKSKTSSLGERISFTGKVDQRKLRILWEEIGVLLVCATSESYGMAVRESLLHGVPVIARSNSSSDKLHLMYQRIIKTYTTKEEVSALIGQFFLNTDFCSDFRAFRMNLVTEQELSLKRLALSWVE
jgi:glycosyltransferase involved in cell wall biosynthesis